MQFFLGRLGWFYGIDDIIYPCSTIMNVQFLPAKWEQLNADAICGKFDRSFNIIFQSTECT